jgi:hypothetical protein
MSLVRLRLAIASGASGIRLQCRNLSRNRAPHASVLLALESFLGNRNQLRRLATKRANIHRSLSPDPLTSTWPFDFHNARRRRGETLIYLIWYARAWLIKPTYGSARHGMICVGFRRGAAQGKLPVALSAAGKRARRLQAHAFGRSRGL